MARGDQSDLSETWRDAKALQEEFKAAQREFVCVELDLALTFCEIAASTNDPQKTKRNRAHAEEAHDAAARFLNQDSLRPAEKQEIRAKIERLESLLRELKGR